MKIYNFIKKRPLKIKTIFKVLKAKYSKTYLINMGEKQFNNEVEEIKEYDPKSVRKALKIMKGFKND